MCDRKEFKVYSVDYNWTVGNMEILMDCQIMIKELLERIDRLENPELLEEKKEG